jgi:hypothetical protein
MCTSFFKRFWQDEQCCLLRFDRFLINFILRHDFFLFILIVNNKISSPSLGFHSENNLKIEFWFLIFIIEKSLMLNKKSDFLLKTCIQKEIYKFSIILCNYKLQKISLPIF